MNLPNETSEEAHNETVDSKQHFITEEKFQLLKHYQRLIFEVTEFSPALRKIVNELITVENLEKVKTTFVATFGNK